MRNTMCAMGLTVLLAGCASTPEPGGPPASMVASRGREIAEYRCAACHAIDAVGESPRSAAPPFWTLGLRFNALSWERTMAQIAQGGHAEMPPVRLSDADVRDLRDYIESLR